MAWGDWGLTREAGARGDTPPLTMEPFDTGWSNGIMARHADDGRPVGHLHWHPNGEIDTVHVHPDFQRMGIGSAMLKHAKSDPVTYESTYPIRHSNNLSAAGRAWANSDPEFYDPGDAHVTPAADDVKDWGWTAMGEEGHVPAHVPYTGQNEERMSQYTYPDAPDRRKFLGAIGGAWPKRWKGNHPDVPWRNEWSPNHPQHDAGSAPWRNHQASFSQARTASEQPRMGININDKTQDYTGQILRGEKTIETRNGPSLHPYVGKRVGLIRTGLGPAHVVGHATIGEPVFYGSSEEFDADYDRHRVGPESPHYITPQGKHGYPMHDVEAVEPWPVTSRGIVSRPMANRTAGANGPYPEGLTFQYHAPDSPDFPDVIDPRQSVQSVFPAVSAHHDGKMVGHMQWQHDHPRRKGEIWDLRVHPEYQRRGVGTAMFDYVTDQIEPDLHHSRNLSDEGSAFANAEVERPLAKDRDNAWRAGQPMPKRFAAYDPSRDAVKAHPDYMYHATNEYNAQDIKDSGSLVPNAFDYGTDQGSWPDGSDEDRSYWHHNPEVTKSFHPEDGKPVLLRAPKHVAPFKQERGTGDSYTTHPVDAQHLEVYHGQGQWHPLHAFGDS